MKLKNIGAQYTGMDGATLVNAHPGDEFEVSDEFGKYLLSDDSPGSFEKAKDGKADKAKDGK